jgi:LuxR family maltose regulon positive regulatory protein
MYRGLALQASGQSEDALCMQRDLYESAIDRSTSYAIRPLMTMCFIHLLDGHLERVTQTAEALLLQGKLAGLPIQQGWGHYFLGVAAYLRNNLAAACPHFEAVIATRHITQHLISTASAYGLVLCYQALGDTARAWQTVHTLNEIDMASRGDETDRTRSIRARLHLLEGRVEDARHVEQSLNVANLRQPLLLLEEPPLTRCRVLLASGAERNLSAALELLESLEDVARTTHIVPARIEVLALRALVLARREGHPTSEALCALAEAVNLARPGGIVRFFLEYGSPMRALLGRLSVSAEQEEFVQRILSAAHSTQPMLSVHEGVRGPVSANNRLTKPLSVRELDILSLMSRRLTDKEIARELTISPKTVKRHAANLYAKLDVNRRWDAVERAIELGLLPPD